MDRLPFQDTARLCVLSQKWNLIWTSYSHIKLDLPFFRNMLSNKLSKCYEFNRILTNVLLTRDGPITKFVLQIPTMDYYPTPGENAPDMVLMATFLNDLSRSNVKFMCSSDIDPAIVRLSRYGVQELALDNYGSTRLKLSSRLFFCDMLRKLRVCNFDVNIPPSFECFKTITDLELDHVTLNGRTLESLISCCPALESLVVKGIVARDSLVINAPNLKLIEVKGTFMPICLKGCVGLSSVTIDLTEVVVSKHHTQEARNLVKFLSSSCKLQELNLRQYYLEFLGGAGLRAMFTNTFDHLRKLELVVSQRLPLVTWAVRVIENCPNLEVLKILFRGSSDPVDREIIWKQSIAFKCLRTVYWMYPIGSNIELKFIQLLLARAPVLEKLYIPSSVNTVPALASALTTNLLRFSRASSKAEILFFDQKI